MSKKLFNQFHCSRMLLPEHRQKLQEHRQEEDFAENYPLPQHDQQQLEDFQYLVEQSLKTGLKIKVTVLTEEGYLSLAGVVVKVNTHLRQLELATETGSKKIASKNIVAIEQA